MKYLSDEINKKDIESWNIGDKIIIDAPTGCGKTHFIQTELCEHCRKTNKKILYLVNRELLNRQLSENKNYEDVITINTYQRITERLNKDPTYNISGYDYIVSDECHYFFSDSLFNNNTDILLEILTTSRDSINIFMSATVRLFKSYMEKYQPNEIVKEYKVIGYKKYDNFYHFRKRETVREILNRIPNNEKAIVFFSNAERAYDYSKEYPNSSFICSKNSKYYDDDMEFTKNQIANECKFDSQFLFTTSVLDNGVNIKDSSVKHIITDIFDLDVVQQCVGRKRFIDENDSVSVYIKTYSCRDMTLELNHTSKLYNLGSDFKTISIDSFIDKYGRMNWNSIIYITIPRFADLKYEDGEGSLVYLKRNEALYHKLYEDRIRYDNLIKCGIDNAKLAAAYLGVHKDDYLDYEGKLDKEKLEKIMNKYIGIKLFKKDKNKIFNEFSKNFVTFKPPRKFFTINYFQKWLKPFEIYKAEKLKSSKVKTKNLVYWIITKINDTKENKNI